MDLNFKVMRVFKNERVRLARVFSVLLLLVAGVGQAWSQNVTIKGSNGNMIASMKNGGVDDTFFRCGGFASWQHEQLNMVLTAADGADLTENGQLSNPANNLFASNGTETDSKIRIAHGQLTNANVCYLTLSLPNGYRFTGYEIKFSRPSNVYVGTTTNGQSVYLNPSGNNAATTFGETGSNFNTYITSASIAPNGAERTITRTEMSEGDMGNVLYFKLQDPSNVRTMIQLESAEFFFTAEENYSPVTPASTITSPVSAVDVPFATSKVDFGKIENNTYQGIQRISYSSANVHDLIGNLHLYEAESVTNGTGIDGISGNVVDYKSGTISSAGGYFQLGRENQEQVYFIETPDHVEVSDGTKVPVGYRIVGANFEYKLPGAETHFYITYTNGNTTYYLNSNRQFVTDTKTEWTTDAQGRVNSNGTYLRINGQGQLTTGTSTNYALTVNGNNHLSGTRLFTTYYLKYNNGNATAATGENGNLASWTEESTTVSSDGFTLYVYDKTGENPEEIVVDNSNASGTYALTGLNNDAVKFGVKGIGLVRATLTLQALDPYLDMMTVVCQDEQQEKIRMTETFTASDFSVSGGEFYFYLPDELKDDDVQITFEDLKSKYFDETYEGGSANHTSRINFVKSLHYNAFGESSNSVYNNTAEAAAVEPLERLKVGTVGTAKFKFNNADEVGTTGGTYQEFPFSLENYTAEGGAFDKMEFTVSAEDQSLTRYVFTTDETRYNIAPTTATQHRAYAFYQMIVHVQSSTYVPKFQFTKIYDETFYDVNSKDAFYGVTVTATDGSGKPGYSSTSAIFEGIEKILNNTHVDDFNNAVPAGTTAKQILYLDFSQLAGVYQITTDEHQSMDDFSATNAANCMIFVPEGSAGSNDNVAYKTASGSYRAANNIVLTDKQPFYTPFDIQVDGANYAQYEREISKSSYNPVECASIILPFAINLEQAAEGASSFTLHTMQNSDAITTTAGKPWAYFPELGEGVTTSEPNTPYLLQVTNNTSENGSFIIKQRGARITTTTKGATVSGLPYLYQGKVSEGTFSEGEEAGNNYTFTSYGTYSGVEIPKERGVFYFAQGRFLNSNTLAPAIETVKILPFRMFYLTTSASPAKFSTLDIIFGEGEGDTDAIRNLRENDADMMVRAGNGTLTITSAVDNDVRINAINGISRGNLSVKAGETKTVSVPAGIYVVNGVKIVVK